MDFQTNSGSYVLRREQGDPSSMSAVPTTTSATSALATPTSTSNTDGGNNGLTGSPPLIVAFLAVGLFMAAMLTIFGWRRMVFGRGFVIQSIERDRFFAVSEYFGEKPELWDLWSRSPVGNMDQLEWEQVMVSQSSTFIPYYKYVNHSRVCNFVQPLSASVRQPENNLPNDPDSQAAVIHNTRSRIPSHIRSIGQQIRRTAKLAGDRNSDTGPAASRTLQVAVAIVMPSTYRHAHELINEGVSSPETQTHKPHDADPLEYSLGLMEMPWHSDEG